jgi:GDP/UDP-N,N'-diacetylbacillosamine 2-epimerase (hydrolysing)
MRSRRITIVSSNRADFYLLEKVIKKLKNDRELSVTFVITGAHLLESMGTTLDDVLSRDIEVDEKINIFSNKNIKNGINKDIAYVINTFDRFFIDNNPDLLIVLGDRFETMAVAMAANGLNIPIAHLYGGETSLGSKDNTYRDLITLLSKLHFVSDENAARKVYRLTQLEENIYQVGHLGLENIRHIQFQSKEMLFRILKVNFPIDVYVCTISLHPATNENVTPKDQVHFLDQLISGCPNIYFVATASNNDLGGNLLNDFYKKIMKTRLNFTYKENLGTEKYLNLCKVSNMVIGNSSSLMYEVPSLGVPVVNLGDRQSGRSRLTNVINMPYSVETVTEMFYNSETNICKDFEQIQIINSSDLIVELIKQYFYKV